MARLVALAWGLGLVALTAAPAFRSPRQDGFPFSTYPMFASPREKPTLYFAEGVTRERATVRIPPELVANGPVMQAMQTLERAQAQGPASLARLCRRIARAVGGKPELSGVERVQITRARFDPIAYFEQGPRREEQRVLTRCSVGGS